MPPPRVLKWSVPVDDGYHPIGSGKVCLVACQYGPDTVQVWTEETDTPVVRSAKVIGTGHNAPDFTEHLGSVITANGALVWHLYGHDGG